MDLVKTKLPQELREKAGEYDITDNFLETMPETIVLLLNSKSIDSKEDKQSWFSLLPMMNQEQIDKLKDILTREKQKLDEIEQKYEQKKADIQNQYIQKFDDGGYKNQMIKIQQKEAVADQVEDQEAENLLNQI